MHKNNKIKNKHSSKEHMIKATPKPYDKKVLRKKNKNQQCSCELGEWNAYLLVKLVQTRSRALKHILNVAQLFDGGFCRCCVVFFFFFFGPQLQTALRVSVAIAAD
jgi:uncharacterized membrane protein